MIAFIPLDTGPPRVPPARYWLVRVPYWFPIALLLALPAARARARHRNQRDQRRRQSGLCVGCGYDLRTSSGRCPECGKELTTPT